MAYWWQRYSSTPDSNTDTPPDGAPENHFPDQVNNIARQAMAATAELGLLILSSGDGTPPPQEQPTQVNSRFLKLIYDQLLPVSTIMAWDSDDGANDFPVPSGAAFASVVWELCDSTGSAGTPNFQNTLLKGASSPAGPNQRWTGDFDAAEDMGGAGAWSKTNRVSSGHRLTVAETPQHDHGATAQGGTLATNSTGNDHSHAVKHDLITAGTGPSTASFINAAGAQTTPNAAANDGTNTDHNHGVTGRTGTSGNNPANLHDHDLPDISESDHIHDAGLPAASSLELYKRVA